MTILPNFQNLCDAIALEAVRNVQRTPTSATAFVAVLKWAYRTKTLGGTMVAFRREVVGGWYDPLFARQ